MSSYILNICRRQQENGLLNDWSILLLLFSLGPRFNSLLCLYTLHSCFTHFTLMSTLHSCFPLPGKMPSLSGYSAFLSGICETLLLYLIQLSQENAAFWLIHGSFTTCVEQVKTALQWQTSLISSFILLLHTPINLFVFGLDKVWRGNVRPVF